MPAFDEPVYEDPKFTAKLSKYERVLAPLKETPGTWGKVGTYKSRDSAYQAALNLRRGRYKLPGSPSEWEFYHEENAVFARYLPGQKKKATKKATKKKT